MDAYLYVSDHAEEWGLDWDGLKGMGPLAYVYNHDMPDCHRTSEGPCGCRILRPWQKEPGGESDKGSRALPAIVHGADPAATIRQIQDIMTDRRNYIPDYEAMTVL